MKSTRTLLCAVSFLSLVCLVIADHHRIIIEERVPPRNHRGRRNEPNKSNGGSHGTKGSNRPKKARGEDETSFEGNGRYSSEEYFLQKYQDSKPHVSNHPHSPHPHHDNFAKLHFEESRSPAPTITEWSPLGSDPTRKRTSSKSRQEKKPKKHRSKIPQVFESTTHFPAIYLQEDPGLNPAIFSPGFVGKQEVHHNPFVGLEQFAGHLKSAEVAYDVSSSDSNLRPFVVIQGDIPEGDTSEQESREEQEVEVTTRRPRRSRSRGRGSQRNKMNY